MISKQKLTSRLLRLEDEIAKLRTEIEKSEESSQGITLRGKYAHLKGISFKDILEAKKMWRPSDVI